MLQMVIFHEYFLNELILDRTFSNLKTCYSVRQVRNLIGTLLFSRDGSSPACCETKKSGLPFN